MAAPKADITTCSTPAEAFLYPLPQIRQFHRHLTVSLDEKNARLRTLVGGSYRQLLGTAETILQMRSEIEGVEEKLDRVGRGCGRSVVGGLTRGLSGLKEYSGPQREQLGWVARVKSLGMCGLVVGRLLRRDAKSGARGENLVLAAKVLVLSRLLAKSLGDASDGRSKADVEAVEELRRKLGVLRRRLLRAIDRTLAKIGAEDGRGDLVLALCAYNLATSHGARDVLNHFLKVRKDAMRMAFEVEQETAAHDTAGILAALELYTSTLLDVQALVPRRLSDALLGLTHPLLKDDAVRGLEELRLEVCEQWFGESILNFTPFVKHDDLDGPNAVKALHGWADEASNVLLEGFQATLQRVLEFKTVVELRTKILEVWIKDGGKAKGFDTSEMLDRFRDIFNDRLVQLLESRADKLHLVGTEIEATLGSWRPGITDLHSGLWDADILGMEVSNGATLFKQGVLARTHGRNDAVSRAIKGYETWRHLIEEIISMIDNLTKQRWDDDLEDIEDDATLETRNDLLSKDDPRLLQQRLDSSLAIAYSQLEEKFTTLLSAYQETEQIGPISVYTLRVLRDIRSELPKNAEIQKFALSLVPSLHAKLAVIISDLPVERFMKRVNRKVIGRSLWEGDPQLPVQPSPRVFKLLHSLTLGMTDIGSDVWSPAAVSVLKTHLAKHVGGGWTTTLELLAEEHPKTNGEPTNDEKTKGDTDGDKETLEESKVEEPKTLSLEQKKELGIQSLFDVLVLQSCFDQPLALDEASSKVEEKLNSEIELDQADRKRLEQSAKMYWKRTSLLFGLLA